MSRPIVVPLDGSLFAETVLPKVLRCARVLDAPIDLVFVAVPPRPAFAPEPSAAPPEGVPQQMTEPLEYLAGVQRRLRSVTGVDVMIHVLDGEPASRIAAHAAATDARLIALSTHGRGGLTRFILGSVADRLAREAHCPLLFIRPGHRIAVADLEGPRTLLVPLDGSPVAESIIDPALAIVGGPDPVLVLMHVVALPPVLLPFADGAVSATAVESNVKFMNDYLERVARPYRDRGLTVRTEVRVGEVAASTVLTVAKEHGADYVAVTTTGRGGVPRAILGSVADKVVRAAEGAVILWNPPRT